MTERRGLIQTTNFPRTTGSFREIPVAGGDPDFASVVLLLDFDGVDGATDITDLSSSAKTETFVVNAEVDTANQYIGENSLLIPAAGDYVSYADDDDWDFPADFTIELGIRWPTQRSTYGIISSHAAPDEGWAIQSAENGANEDINFIANNVLLMSETLLLSKQVFHHVAVSRSGTDLRMFFNGVQLGSTTVDDPVTSITGTKLLKLGVLIAPATQGFPLGQIGALRITKGVARYTENFTPPTTFYPTS